MIRLINSNSESKTLEMILSQLLKVRQGFDLRSQYPSRFVSMEWLCKRKTLWAWLYLSKALHSLQLSDQEQEVSTEGIDYQFRREKLEVECRQCSNDYRCKEWVVFQIASINSKMPMIFWTERAPCRIITLCIWRRFLRISHFIQAIICRILPWTTTVRTILECFIAAVSPNWQECLEWWCKEDIQVLIKAQTASQVHIRQTLAIRSKALLAFSTQQCSRLTPTTKVLLLNSSSNKVDTSLKWSSKLTNSWTCTNPFSTNNSSFKSQVNPQTSSQPATNLPTLSFSKSHHFNQWWLHSRQLEREMRFKWAADTC